jgi:hypothetical protein
VEVKAEVLLATVDEETPVNFRSYDVSKEIQSLKLGKTSGLDLIPKQFLRYLPRRPLVHLKHLFNHCLRPGHFSVPSKEAKIITLHKPGKDSKFSPKRRSDQPLVHYRQIIRVAGFNENPKTRRGKKLT